jgi:hypothetical protein
MEDFRMKDFRVSIGANSSPIPHSRGMILPELYQMNAHERRGRRECQVPGRTRSLACENKKHTSKSPQVHRNNPTA